MEVLDMRLDKRFSDVWSRVSWLMSALLAVLLIALTLAPARAEEPAPKGPPRVVELEAMVIEGKVAKPQVFYVLGRSRVQYQSMKMRGSFVDRIVEDARKNPF